jgi:hypothetical protein
VEARGLVLGGGLGRERRDPRHNTALLSEPCLNILNPKSHRDRSLNPETQFQALNPEK